MNKKLRYAFLITTCIAASIDTSWADEPAATFNAQQQAEIGKIAADYLVAHPEILVQVSQKLQEQQAKMQEDAFKESVLKNQAALLNDKNTPAVGPDAAKVAFIEFFDYQCIYCSHMAPIVEKVMQANTQVKYLFKEWPIFGSRWQPSVSAAQAGLYVWRSKGASAYLNFHNGIYKTGHNEGQLTDEDISAVLKTVGVSTPTQAATAASTATLNSTNQLAQQLGISGTPAFIIMPTTGANKENTTVFAGAVDEGALRAAIVKAAGH